MTYAAALEFLEGLSNFEREGGWRYDAKNFSLDRMRTLLEALGHPERRYRAVIIAGTKGKGSTAAMLTAVLGAAGRRVGLYTSPHLVEYLERIRLGLDPVGHGTFAELAGAVEPAVTALAARGVDWRPTTFEALTGMALLAFARQAVEVAVLEVGLGGRLDAVNAVEAVAVGITSIGHDHVDQLGTTIPAIAGEKAGVIKSAAPVVATGRTGEGALPVIEAACRRAGAPLTVTGVLDGFPPALAGRHQRENAAIAVALARIVAPGIDDETIRQGLAAVRWPGRLQVLTDDPLVLLDGAHTVESAIALRDAVLELRHPVRLRLVMAMLRGKDHAGTVGVLAPLAEHTWCPTLHHPRALPAAELAAVVTAAGGRAVAGGSVAASLAAARGGFSGTGHVILVTGSLALVGEAMVS